MEAENETVESISLPDSLSTWKVLGRIDVGDGIGVLAHNTATSGRARGVLGVVDSESQSGAAGVRGNATSHTGQTYGVFGKTASEESDAAGVRAFAPSGSANGVQTEGAFGVLATGRRNDTLEAETGDLRTDVDRLHARNEALRERLATVDPTTRTRRRQQFTVADRCVYMAHSDTHSLQYAAGVPAPSPRGRV